MASAARPTEKKERLLHILVHEAAVEEAIARWIIEDENGPQCESPADYAQLWTTTTADTGPKVDILDNLEPKVDTTTFKGRKLVGRLRTAWDYCCHDHAGEAKALAAPPPAEDEDIKQLWPDARRNTCEQAVLKLYKVRLDYEVTPSSPIMQRLDRVWKDRKADIMLLTKMRTQSDFALIIAQPAKERRLGVECGETSLFLRTGAQELPPLNLEATEQVIQAMEVMANGWLLLGTQDVTSQLTYLAASSTTALGGGTANVKVPDFDINDRDNWVKHARKMAKTARANGDSEATIVRYLRLREHETRQVAIKYWKERSFPWGEALQQAMALEMAVLWTITGQTNGYGVQVNVPGITDVGEAGDRGQKRLRSPRRSPSPPPPRAQRPREHSATQDRGKGSTIPREYLGVSSRNLLPHMLCTDYNGGGCYCAKASLCPQGRLHRCNYLMADRTICGAQGHAKPDCPADPRNGGKGQRAPPGNKGKGGKGGKGGKDASSRRR